MVLLISKPLFAICEKHIFFPFMVFGAYNFRSMSVRLIREAGIMADRGAVFVLSPNDDHLHTSFFYGTKVVHLCFFYNK